MKQFEIVITTKVSRHVFISAEDEKGAIDRVWEHMDEIMAWESMDSEIEVNIVGEDK
jgi:hypothetical protein